MKKPFIFRKNNVIRTINDDGTFTDEKFSSNNKARHKMAQLYKEYGNGMLSVVTKFPQLI